MSQAVYKSRKPSYYAPYLARFKSEGPLLELGSGMGLMLDLCRERVIAAVGLELDEFRVARCKERALDARVHDLGEPLPFPDESFGMVYSGQVIEHVPEKVKRTMFREAWRVLRPGGQFQVVSPCRHYEPARLQPGHDHLVTPSELHDLLVAAGWSEINLDYNVPQVVPELPEAVLRMVWDRYRPDLMSQTATAVCTKGRDDA